MKSSRIAHAVANPTIKPTRPGRMPRWLRWTTWILVGAALVSGLGYLLAMDVVDAAPAPLAFWWVLHGVAGLVAVLAIGGAAAGHAIVAWRARRGRVLGALNATLLLVAFATAVALYYGPQFAHATASAAHWIVGLVALVAFPLHVWRGRRRA